MLARWRSRGRAEPTGYRADGVRTRRGCQVTASADDVDDAEVTLLRARVAELEHLLAEQIRATNALVASSQEKLYWLERWHVDLDAVMRRPGAERALEAVKLVRSGVRSLRRAKRRLLG